MKKFLKEHCGVKFYEEITKTGQVKITAERDNIRRILVVYYKHKKNEGKEHIFRDLAFGYFKEIQSEFCLN